MRLFTEQPVVQRKPDTETTKSLHEILHDWDVSDAKAWQNAAALNSNTLLRGRVSFPVRYYPSTELLAAKQYAYARKLMGIDDYYDTLPGARLPTRPHRTP
jgi:hypothetical protein